MGVAMRNGPALLLGAREEVRPGRLGSEASQAAAGRVVVVPLVRVTGMVGEALIARARFCRARAAAVGHPVAAHHYVVAAARYEQLVQEIERALRSERSAKGYESDPGGALDADPAE